MTGLDLLRPVVAQSTTADVLAWLRGQEYRSVDGVPQLILDHMGLSAAALGVAVVIAMPLALWLAHQGRAPVASINAANAFRAVPAFGLLLVAFQLGGFSTALLIAVFSLIGVAPIFANTYVGIRQVDPEVVDAAAGMGLTGRQQLLQVELPLAAPVIMAGVRTAAVNIVATVTLAAFVGFGGLGEPIRAGLSFGLQRSDSARALALGGSLIVAALSIGTEGLLGLLQRRIVPEGLRLREAAQARAAEPVETTTTASV